MINQLFRKCISFLLALIMTIQLMPWNVFATEFDSSSDVDESQSTPVVEETSETVSESTGTEDGREIDIIEEIETLRTENTKHFRMSDGSYMAVSYNMPVHYKNEDGGWEDIDNSMILITDESESAVYSAENGEERTTFGETLEDGFLFSTSYNGKEVTMSVLDEADSSQAVEASAAEPETETAVEPDKQHHSGGIGKYNRSAKASVKNENNKSNTTGNRKKSKEEELIPEKLNASIQYEDVYTGVDFEYEVSGYNIKESIIINTPMDEYCFSFFVSLDGLSAKLQDDGAIGLIDETGSVIYEIPAPYMFDAENNISEEVYYTIDESENGFTLTVTAEAEWINAVDRAYPVTIDPTLFINAGSASGDISATYVEQGTAGECNGGQQTLYVGYSSYQSLKNRWIYMHFNDLPEVPAESVIVGATLNLWQYDYSNINEASMAVGVYPVTEEKGSGYSSYHNWICGYRL